MQALKRITLRLARNPHADAPEGDAHRGYSIVAPLDDEGRIDLAAWRANRDACTVVRFSPDPAERADGWLTHNGAHWSIRYDEDREGPDEPVFRLLDHPLVLNAFVSIQHGDGEQLVYRVTEVLAVRD